LEREFIMTNEFEKCWKINKLTEEELRQLELYLLQNPEVGDLVKETGGLRKLRWSYFNKGKAVA